MKEVITFYRPYLVGTSILQSLIPLAKSTECLIYVGYKISANYPLFLNIKLDRNKTVTFFVAHS